MSSKTLTQIHSELVTEFGHANLSISSVATWTNQCLGDLADCLRLEAQATITLVAGQTEYTSEDEVPTDIHELLGARYWDISNSEPDSEFLSPVAMGDFAQPGIWYFNGTLYVQELDHDTGDKLYLFYFRTPVKVAIVSSEVSVDIPELFDYLPVTYGCARHQQSWLQDVDSARSYLMDYNAGKAILDQVRRKQTEAWMRHMPPSLPPRFA